MNTPFSVVNRKIFLQKLSSEAYDVVVIGGGITGAGIALDAASRGLKTALIEKDDFASGTSSRSTKLIHGGLRYLKQLEFGLVKEVGSERAVIHKLAPHLVVPEKMLLPLYERKGLGYWLTSVGLKIYDFLAGVKPEDQRIMLTRNQTLRHEPLLKSDDVKGGAIYAEYRTDDARLTIETIKRAVNFGANVINYLKVTNFLYDQDGISGIEVTDQISHEIFSIQAKSVVSAAGPWVDELREKDESKTGKYLHLTKGVHIVVPHQKFPIQQAIYFDVPDTRMIFAIPRGRVTYIGTTDTNYNGEKDKVITTTEDATYLLDGVRSAFSNVQLSLDDIESSWAGLRPLIHEEGKSASELSRKDEIFESPSGLISIAGGKLTGYRKMAERVVNLVIKRKFPEEQIKACYTDKIDLVSHSFRSVKDVKVYHQEIERKLKPYELSGYTSRYLIETYGKQTEAILNYFFTMTDEIAERSLLQAEAWFCIHHEMATGLQDFFVRRTGLLYFDIRKVNRHLDFIACYFATQLGWDPQRIQQEKKQLELRINEVTAFKRND